MIQRWTKLYSVPEDDCPVTYYWVHKVGKSLDGLGTIREIPCDCNGWIDGLLQMPDVELTGTVQVVLNHEKPKKGKAPGNTVGTSSVRLVAFGKAFAYYTTCKEDKTWWRYWQPLANLPGDDNGS